MGNICISASLIAAPPGHEKPSVVHRRVRGKEIPFHKACIFRTLAVETKSQRIYGSDAPHELFALAKNIGAVGKYVLAVGAEHAVIGDRRSLVPDDRIPCER